MSNRMKHTPLDRRSFLHMAAAAGVGLTCRSTVAGQTLASAGIDDINVALIGAGAQGCTLMEATRRIPGIRFQAVCDIWETYNLKRTVRILHAYGHPVNAYIDYKEMLDAESDLDAVIVATPDCWHAEHSIACLEAGLHVYCETEMSNTIDGARRMVQAARKSGKLLQIGRQRRSNTRYVFARDKLLGEANLLGQITAVTGQWNWTSGPTLGWPKRTEIDLKVLNKYGYRSMQQFRNWRWYKGLGGGRVVGVGSRQIDTYNWYLGARPKSVFATGHHLPNVETTGRWHDTVMVVYEYDTAQGPVSAYYQIISSNSSFDHFESFLGDRGTLVMSEASWRGEAYRERTIEAKAWAPWVEKGYLRATDDLNLVERDLALPMYIVHETPPGAAFKQPPYKLPVRMDKPRHQEHLENFFDAIRGKVTLACPAEVGYETAVTVLRINEAIEAQRKLFFKPEDFVA